MSKFLQRIDEITDELSDIVGEDRKNRGYICVAIEDLMAAPEEQKRDNVVLAASGSGYALEAILANILSSTDLRPHILSAMEMIRNGELEDDIGLEDLLNTLNNN